MTYKQLLQNPEFKQKFVLEKLIQDFTSKRREEIWLHLDEEIENQVLERILSGYRQYVEDKKPLEYILWHVDFFGKQFYVNENTIIPRPETEYMVQAVSDEINQTKKSENPKWTLLDIWTGSWILGISILLQNLNAFENVFFSDISEEALIVAKKNYDNLVNSSHYDTRFIISDLADFINNYDIISNTHIILVANLPYIPDETFDNNALENVQKREPRLAFVWWNDGLDLYRKMFNQIIKSSEFSNNLLQSFVLFLEMMTWQVEILRKEFGDIFQFEEVKTFHFNIRIVKVVK